MQFKHGFKISFTALKTHKSRSALTILGIVIGITSIILIMSLGKGAENLILSEISVMGGDTIAIEPGKEPKGPTDIAGALFTDSLKERDVEALKKKSNAPGIIDVAPEVIVSASISYKGETYKPLIVGQKAELFGEMLDLYPEEGRLFDDDDIRQNASVAVIGQKVKKELFGESDAVGENVKIKDRNFRVVGVLPSRGQSSLFNVDELVVVPYSTAQKYLLGIDYYHEIVVRVASPDWVDRTVRDIKITLRELHGITDPEDDDFYVVTQEGAIEQIQTIMGILTLFLAAVVAISLVVGGVGVMNIMLVSVTERTREIGLRKALGATTKDILIQFLLEAVSLTAMGGVIGIILGSFFAFLFSAAISHFANLNWEFTFSIPAVLLGIGVSAFVGLIFGIYPARKASRKSPIEALRYE